MFRYRKITGVSRDVVTKFNRVRPKLGKITRIIGHRFAATRGTGDNKFTTDFEVVMVYGENGTARFDGVCWGYAGEGPRVVHEMLLVAGVEPNMARTIAFKTKRQTIGLSDLLKTRRQIDWEVSFN